MGTERFMTLNLTWDYSSHVLWQGTTGVLSVFLHLVYLLSSAYIIFPLLSIPTFLLPLLLFPYSVASIILCFRQFLYSICPIQKAFSFVITHISFLSYPILVSTSSFLILSVQFTLIILLDNHISEQYTLPLCFWLSMFHSRTIPHFKFNI